MYLKYIWTELLALASIDATRFAFRTVIVCCFSIFFFHTFCVPLFSFSPFLWWQNSIMLAERCRFEGESESASERALAQARTILLYIRWPACTTYYLKWQSGYLLSIPSPGYFYLQQESKHNYNYNNKMDKLKEVCSHYNSCLPKAGHVCRLFWTKKGYEPDPRGQPIEWTWLLTWYLGVNARLCLHQTISPLNFFFS